MDGLSAEIESIWTGEQFYAGFGWVRAAAGSRGLVRIALQAPPGEAISSPGSGPAARAVAEALEQLGEYFARARRSFSVPIDWLAMPLFQQRVLRLAEAIPYGEVRAYGQIARELGQPGAARAVGRALAANPIGILLPCHRVIGADGSLHGFSAAGGLATKSWLLELEGVKLEHGRVLLPGAQPALPGLF